VSLHDGCTLSFHPLCARRNGWLLSAVTHQNSPRQAFCGRHSISERRRLNGDGPLRGEHGVGASGAGGRGAGGRGRGPGRPPLPGGRGGRGATLGRPKGSYTKRRPPPTREEMELLKRARFGLEKLRLLCERVLKREKFKRSVGLYKLKSVDP
jgi:bromodomain and PHD finger-containing protein 1